MIPIAIVDSNPYEPPESSESDALPTRARLFVGRLRAVFYVHLFTVVLGTFVVRNDAILSIPYLELFIVLPLVLTILACPIAIMIVVAFTKPRSLTAGCFAITADLILSLVQYFQWIPTIQ
ncbi:hypothetical protein SH528x_002959 [Novipirellula sp. SH528]|uniref:hypothetical protein n=1 Tax=Novipirellula sp. SH528 TaxID=3454466 RepID=UPI003F9FED19